MNKEDQANELNTSLSFWHAKVNYNPQITVILHQAVQKYDKIVDNSDTSEAYKGYKSERHANVLNFGSGITNFARQIMTSSL